MKIQRKIALFDIDGTILPLGGLGFFNLVDHLTSVKLVDPIKTQIMHQTHTRFLNGLIGYEDHATIEFTSLAQGLKGQLYEKVG